MSRTSAIYRKKISVGLEILAKVLSENITDRKAIVSILKDYYQASGVKPFMGAKVREDLYDKELTTLYVIGKYGMGLDEDNREVFEKIFDKELKIEKAIELLLSSMDAQQKKEAIKKIMETEIDGNEASRIFRVAFTKVILGFGKEEDFARLLSAFQEAFPEHKKTVENYAKFYIAYRLSEKLNTGEISDKLSKEIEKQAMNLRLGLGFTLPDDKYIYAIAKNVFGIPQEKLSRILSLKEEAGDQKE
jgi:hypothetical protein